MKLFLVRHAEKAESQATHPELGRLDQPISRHGRSQAKKLARYLGGLGVDRIYVSMYRRTRQTIEPLARHKHLDINVDPRLNEIDVGLVETMPDEQLQERYPDVWDAYRARDRDFRYPGGETGDEAMARIRAFLDERARDNVDVVAVAHDGIIRVAMCSLLGLPSYRRSLFRVDTTGVFELEYDRARDGWHVIRMNQSV